MTDNIGNLIELINMKTIDTFDISISYICCEMNSERNWIIIVGGKVGTSDPLDRLKKE